MRTARLGMRELLLTGQWEAKRMRYQPIENHGIIGNMHSAALVSMDGSVDWLCLPRFDSPSVFGAILDADKGGRFRITPTATGALRQKQSYWPDTNVLITRFLHPDGIAEVEDYMPVGPGAEPAAQLVRRVRVVRGRLSLQAECRPAFDYARASHAVTVSTHGARFDGPGLSLGLAASVPLRADNGGAVAEFLLDGGQSATFVLRTIAPDAQSGRCPRTEEAGDWFRETVAYWQRWSARCTYRGRWREVVLQLRPLAAARAAHLPADQGDRRRARPPACRRGSGVRELGLPLHLDSRCRLHGLRLPAGRVHRGGGPVHGLSDRPLEGARVALRRAIATHVRDGRPVRLDRAGVAAPRRLRGSRPVRVGNAAHGQLQLDIYGELMEAVYLHNKYAAPVGYDSRRHLRDLVDWVAGHWGEEDEENIWEVRRGAAALRLLEVHVLGGGLDRGLRLADKRLPSRPTALTAWLERPATRSTRR